MRLNLTIPKIFKLTSALYGELIVGHLALGDLYILEKELNNDKIDKHKFLHYFGSLVICRQNQASGKEDVVDKKLRLSQEEVEALPPEEFELFCQKYIKHYESQENYDLAPCAEERKTTEEYLYCFIKNEINVFLQKTKKLIQEASAFASSAIFSDNIIKQLSQASTVSKSLSSSLSNWKHYSENPALETTIANFDKHLKLDPKDFRNPVEDTNTFLESLIEYQKNLSPVIVNTASLLKEMHEIGISVATDLKISSKKSSFYSFITIVIASLSLLATCVFSYMSYQSSKNTEELFMNSIQENTAAIKNLSSSYLDAEEKLQYYISSVDKSIALNKQRVDEIKLDESELNRSLIEVDEQNSIYLKAIAETLDQIKKEQKSMINLLKPQKASNK